MKSGSKRTVNQNKYQSKLTTKNRNQYLDYLNNPKFQGVNKLFVLSFKENAQQTRNTRYFFPNVEIKDYNVMIYGPKDFAQSVKNDLRTFDNVRKNTIHNRNDCTTG